MSFNKPISRRRALATGAAALMGAATLTGCGSDEAQST